MHKVWIEAALNGAWSRKLQPGIPDTVEAIVAEGIACARAGATIIHAHAYDGGGPQTFRLAGLRTHHREAFARKSTFRFIPSYPAFTTTGGDASPSRMRRFDLPISRRLPRAACWISRSSTPAAPISVGDDVVGRRRRPAPT